MIGLAVKLLLAYLLGSVSGGLLLGRWRRIDVRAVGSGNAGATNALRAGGVWFALGVAVVDIGKGVVAALLIPKLPMGPDAVAQLTVQCGCGIAAIVGHNYPVFFAFRGGKGAATFVGAAAALLPIALAPVLSIWVLTLILTGYVGLATIIAAVSFVPVAAWLAAPEALPTLLPFATVSAALIVFAHRGNIRRLREGRENRFDKVRLARWLKRG